MKRKSLNAKIAQSNGLENRHGFSRPMRLVELVEGQHGTLWHAWEECLQRNLRRFVNVKIEVKHGNNQVLIVFQILGNGPYSVAAH